MHQRTLTNRTIMQVIIMIILVSCCFTASAQSTKTQSAYGLQPLQHATLTPFQKHQVIAFTVPSEVNVAHYTIEAGDDSVSFDIIGTIKPVGNTMLARTYKYEVFSPFNKYYRVGTIGMNGRTAYTIIPSSGAGKTKQMTLPQNEGTNPSKPLAVQKK